jgi:signal transduction histidine kinase
MDSTPQTRREDALIAALGQVAPPHHLCSIFEMVLDSITDRFFAVDRYWRYTFFNKLAKEQLTALGKDPAKLIGKVLWEEFPDAGSEAELRRAMSERVVVNHEDFYPPLGEWYENRIYPTPDGGLAILQKYVGRRKRAEMDLRRNEALLAVGQEITRTGSWAWNASSGELLWSPEHFRIFGFDVAAGAPPVDEALRRLHPDDRPRWEEAFYRAVRGRANFDVEGRVLHPDGPIRHVRSMGRPVLDEGGQVLEYVGVIMDTTEQKAVIEARIELAHVNRVMTMGELAASIAHELNQPLAAVVTNANACERWLGAPTPNIGEANAALRRISGEAYRASEVIARIRGLLSRGTSRKTELRIDEVIRDASLLMQREVQAKNVSMHVTAAEGLPAIEADPVQLQQVILNLVMNAIEAMSALEAPRTLEVRAEPHGEDGVLVAVRDSGIGVDPRLTDRIFDAFFTTKSDGMGMGLAISRSIVEAHGGKLWATNNDGGGATFQFTVPARMA